MPSILNLSEIIPDRFYFASTPADTLPKTNDEYVYFTIDDCINYPTIQSYFGPPSLGDLYRYSVMMNTFLQTTNPNRKIVHCTSISNPKKRANAAFLVGAYSVLYLKKHPREAFNAIMSGGQPDYIPFCDTTNIKGSGLMQMKSFFRAIYKTGHILKFFDFNDFDINEYERMGTVMKGDMNWVLPDKFIAFMGPMETSDSNGCEAVLNYFARTNVSTVIRCNYPMYNANCFRKYGMAHVDLYFPDCTAPSNEILRRFLEISENTPGVVAVHCKAGMGRTGTLIAAYIIKHYEMDAIETVAWLRICRPGSIIGLQLKYLKQNEKWLKNQGRLWRLRNPGQFVHEFHYPIYSIKKQADGNLIQKQPVGHMINLFSDIIDANPGVIPPNIHQPMSNRLIYNNTTSVSGRRCDKRYSKRPSENVYVSKPPPKRLSRVPAPRTSSMGIHDTSLNDYEYSRYKNRVYH